MYFKVDERFAFHPKAIQARNASLGLWVRAGAWVMGNLTDGYLPKHMISTLGGRSRDAQDLVAVGLWQPVKLIPEESMNSKDMQLERHEEAKLEPNIDHTRATAKPESNQTEAILEPQRSHEYTILTSYSWPEIDGFIFADWPDWNPTKAFIYKEKEASAVRKRKERMRKQSRVTSSVSAGTVTRDLNIDIDINKEINKENPQDPRDRLLRDEFKLFAEKYPGNVPDDGAAFEAFRFARREASIHILVMGAENYAEEARGKEPNFIKRPENWLRDKRWLDTPSKKPKQTVRRTAPLPEEFEDMEDPTLLLPRTEQPQAAMP